MAKPKKYTIRRTARFDAETDKLLIKRAKTMKLQPAVAIRVMVEHSLKGGKVEEPAQ